MPRQTRVGAHVSVQIESTPKLVQWNLLGSSVRRVSHVLDPNGPLHSIDVNIEPIERELGDQKLLIRKSTQKDLLHVSIEVMF